MAVPSKGERWILERIRDHLLAEKQDGNPDVLGVEDRESALAVTLNVGGSPQQFVLEVKR